jgi:outer membrane murein-binding lipoprotein Lpp
MKVHEKRLAVVAVCFGLLLLAACTSSGDGVANSTPEPGAEVDATIEPEAEVTVAVEEPTPTSVPVVEASDEERLQAAVAQFETDVEAGDIRSVFAYDLLDSRVDENGDVTLTVCAWAGDSVFDEVRDSIYRTQVDQDGTVTASHVTTPVAAGECLNTQLIDSALDHINAYDEFIVQAAANPESFSDDPRRVLSSEQALELTSANFEGFVENSVYVEANRPPGLATDTAVDDLLWRRLTAQSVSVLEVAVCRDMMPDRGIYRDGVLLDSGRSEGSPGLHSIDSFQLIQDPAMQGGWLVSGGKQIIWSDCFFAGDWVDGANIFQPRDVEFLVLER